MNLRYLLNLVSDRLYALPLLVLYITDGCNSRCVTCDIWRNPRRNMAMELVDYLADQCVALGTRWVLLSGGEAMQHPEWAAIARRFHQQGIHTMLLTNGLFVQKQADQLAGAVDELIVSLDSGTAATYQAIRGVDTFELVLAGIRAARERGIPVATRTTLQRDNYAELPQIIDAAKAAGVNRISFLTVDVSNPVAFGNRAVETPVGASAEPNVTFIAHAGPGSPIEHGPAASALTPADVTAFDHLLDRVERDYAADFASGLISESPAKLRRMVDYFRALNGEEDFEPPRCNAPHISVVVEVDGSLRPCYFLPGMGRLRWGQPLTEALNAPAALDLRRAYRSGEREECARCVCPLYKGARSLLQM
jgi:MoaA/NifB/PqqE/SkfB family radical SAM enzyme